METVYVSVNDKQFPGDERLADAGRKIEASAIRLLTQAGLVSFDTLDEVIEDIVPEWRGHVGLYKVTVTAEYLGRDTEQPADD